MSDALRQFIEARVTRPDKSEDPRAVRERQHNDARRERGEAITTWKKWVAQTHATDPDGAVHAGNLTALREACRLSVGDVSEILGVTPQDVESFESGKTTYADASFTKLASAMAQSIVNSRTGGDA